MGTRDDDQVRRLFLEARQLDARERKAFLDQACAGNPELRSEVEALLAHDERPSGLLGEAWTDEGKDGKDLDSTELAPPRSPAMPERVGPYRILERLGEGGMGVVYLAEQTEPVRRKVALKIIKHGMDTKQVVARFEAERQALAMMDHPSVAKVFDAGTTEGGRPYFAMEYVQGVPITEHCNRHRLTTQERLALFQQVCDGVQHAHQNAIIHRDLKPSNVLVSYLDGKATPKIIDFGVAKAIKHRLTEKTLFTEMGVLIGTPEYMSPEQAEMTGQNVDTRTDVYSLGVILYELLVGALPFESRELRRAGFDEIRRKIREDEPSKPSARLSTLEGERSTESAKLRKTDASALRRQLSGDLDWITMKALEKDRARRYNSPSEFAADLERHLTSQPVLASPPSAAYRASKFVRRNRVLVGGIAATLVMLLAGIAVSTMFGLREAAQRREAVRQRDEATRQRYVANIIAIESSLRLGEVGRTKRLLATCPPNLRGWEWSYFEKRVDQSLATMTEHGDAVSTVAFSPDGTRIASGGDDNNVRLWDAASGELLAILAGHDHYISAVAFSPDGTRIASSSRDETLRIWDAASGDLLQTLPGNWDEWSGIAFSPDGARIASGRDKKIRVWDVATGRLLTTLRGHEKEREDNEDRRGMVVAIDFSPDGTRIVSAGINEGARVWDVESGETVATLSRPDWPVLSVDFSPDGTRIASGSNDHTILLWDPASGEILSTLRGHESQVGSVSFSPDGTRLASGSHDNTVRLWDTASGELVATLMGHEWVVWSVAFSPDGTRVASGSFDGTVRVWDAASDDRLEILEGHENWVLAMALSPDGTRIVSGSRDRTVRLWDTASGELLQTLTGHDEWVTSVAFSPDGTRIASASRDLTVLLWDAASGERIVTEHPDIVGGRVVFSPDGIRIVSDHDEESVRLVDLASGDLVATLTGLQQGMRTVAFSPDGTRIVSGSDDTNVRLWDASTGELLTTLAGHEGEIYSVAFSPDGTRVASASDDKTARLWDLASGELLATLTGHEDSVYSITFSPDGTRIVSASGDFTLRKW